MSTYTALLQQMTSTGSMQINAPVRQSQTSRPSTSTAGWHLKLRNGSSSVGLTAPSGTRIRPMDTLLRTPMQPAWWKASVERRLEPVRPGGSRASSARSGRSGMSGHYRPRPPAKGRQLTTEAIGDVASLRKRAAERGDRTPSGDRRGSASPRSRPSAGAAGLESDESAGGARPEGSGRDGSARTQRRAAGGRDSAGGGKQWRPNSGRSVPKEPASPRSQTSATGTGRRRGSAKRRQGSPHSSAASPELEAPEPPQHLLVSRRTPDVNYTANVDGDMRAPALLTQLWPSRRGMTPRSAYDDRVMKPAIPSAYGGFSTSSWANVDPPKTAPGVLSGRGHYGVSTASSAAGFGLSGGLNTIQSVESFGGSESSFYDPSGGIGSSSSTLFASCSSLGQSSRVRQEMEEVKKLLVPEQGRSRATTAKTQEAISRLEPLLTKGRAVVERKGRYKNPPPTDEEIEAMELAGTYVGEEELDMTPSSSAVVLAKMLQLRAILARASGDQEGAAMHSEEALIFNPTLAGAHKTQGVVQMSKELSLNAATSFNAGLQSEPSNSNLAEELQQAVRAVGHHRQQRQRARTPPKEYPDPKTVMYFDMPRSSGGLDMGGGGAKAAAPSASDSDAGNDGGDSGLPKAVYPPLKEEPKEKQKLALDDSWKMIDIADIMEEQAKNKHLIEEALLDGQIDEEELEAMSWMLKRSGLTKAKKEQVLTAITKNCEEKVQLGEEDMELLKSITPPDPTQDWKRIMTILGEEVGFLKTIFRVYCLEGRTGTGDMDTMTMGQFTKFCKACNITGKDVPVSTIDRIYLRANQDRLGDIDELMDGNMTKKQKAKQKATKGDARSDELDVHEFGAATIRVAHQKYRALPSVADRYRKLMDVNIKSNNIFEIEDDLSFAVDSEPVRELMSQMDKPLQRLFDKWCAADATAFTAAENSTMNLEEWMMFLNACKLVGPGGVTTRIARGMFVQVNLDDELYEQSDSDNDASELVYDEFAECVIRLADAIHGSGAGKASKVEKGDISTDEGKEAWYASLAEMLGWFIEEELIPRALKKGKYR